MKFEKNSPLIQLPSLTIAISTVAENLSKFIRTFKFSNLINADEVIIVIQGVVSKEEISKLSKNYIIIRDDKTGLSASRNIAIFRSSCDYIWFFDDDIILYKDSISALKKKIAKNKMDLYTIRMNYSDNNLPYKIYSDRLNMLRRDSLRVSSVELIASKKFLLINNITFNENLGLGTNFPSCEENIFYLDIYDNKANIVHIDDYLISHHYVNRKKSHFSNPSILFAKGIFCKRYGGVFGFMILIYFAFKSMSVDINIRLLIQLFKGYVHGKKYI